MLYNLGKLSYLFCLKLVPGYIQLFFFKKETVRILKFQKMTRI